MWPHQSHLTKTCVALQGGFSSADGLCSPKSGTSHGVSAKLGSPQTGDQMAAASTRHAMDGIEQAAPSRPRQPPANPDMLEGWVSQTARQDGTAAAEQRRHGQQQHSSEQQHNSEQQQSSEQQQPAQPTAPLVTGLDDACSDPDAVPTGVAAPMMGGEYLLLYPERPINVPELQVASRQQQHLFCDAASWLARKLFVQVQCNMLVQCVNSGTLLP